MTEHPRISLAPDVLAGKPVIRGTRLSLSSPAASGCDRSAGKGGRRRTNGCSTAIVACSGGGGAPEKIRTPVPRFVVSGGNLISKKKFANRPQDGPLWSN